MKKYACLLIALVMLLGLMPGTVHASPSLPDQVRDHQGIPLQVRAQTLYRGELLMLTNKGLYAFNPKMTDQLKALATKDQLPDIHWLVAQGDRLYGLDINRGLLYPLDAEKGVETNQKAVQLAGRPFDDHQNDMMPEQLVLMGDTLFALYRPDHLNGYGTELFAWDVTDGSAREVKVPAHLQAIAGYRDQRLLGLTRDAWTAANTGEASLARPDLVSFDPISGDSVLLDKLWQAVTEDVMAFCWQEEDDSILYLSDNKLYKRDASGQEVLCGHLSNIMFWGDGDRIVPLPGQVCAILNMETSHLRTSMPMKEEVKPLSIYGFDDTNTHMKVLRDMPEVPVQLIQSYMGERGKLAALLTSGAAEVDLLFLASEQEAVGRLIDKGYLMDLSGSAAIRTHLSRCYPFLQEAAMRGEAIYLLPVRLEATIYLSRPALFEQTGLKIPETFEDVCNLVKTWMDEKADSFQDIRPIAETNIKKALQRQALRLALADQAQKGEGFQFETSLARSLLCMAGEVDTGVIDRPDTDFSVYHMPGLLLQGSYSLFSITSSGTEGWGEKEEPLLLKPEKGATPALPVCIGYLAVYSRTGNREDALRYAESYLNNLDHETQIKLYPDENRPLQPKGIEDIIARLQKEEVELAEQLKTAEGTARSQLQIDLEEKRKVKESQIGMRYHISPEVIAQFRKDMAYAFVENDDFNRLMTDHQLGFYQLFSRFQDGQISLDQYLQEAEGKLRLMRLEDE
ncbi:MAG TPA: hypothetical protein GX006_02350 [Clostridiales bacterium]|jgi:hypothetical protein|nr:hypothetical protein [Clostridiales bacterium]